MSIGVAVVILLAAIVLAGGIWGAVALMTRRLAAAGIAPQGLRAAPTPVAAAGAPAQAGALVDGQADQRAELVRLEERLLAREEKLETRTGELGERERLLAERMAALEGHASGHGGDVVDELKAGRPA